MIALDAGTVGDIATSAERGPYMGLVMSVLTFQSLHFPSENSIRAVTHVSGAKGSHPLGSPTLNRFVSHLLDQQYTG